MVSTLDAIAELDDSQAVGNNVWIRKADVPRGIRITRATWKWGHTTLPMRTGVNHRVKKKCDHMQTYDLQQFLVSVLTEAKQRPTSVWRWGIT